MNLIFKLVRWILIRIFSFLVIAALLFYAWNHYKQRREAKTFVVSFVNVDGLTKGAPIYVRGVQVGKVVQIFPIANSDRIAVKGLITIKDFPTPGNATHATIVNNIQAGGGKIIELRNVEQVGPLYKVVHRGQGPLMIEQASRIALDTFQLTKDFASDLYKSMNTKQSQYYREQLENSVRNTITSIEYGTVEHDLNSGIEELNQRIKQAEEHHNEEEKKKAMMDQLNALKNTVSTFSTVTDVYKKNDTSK
jgi:ABC-type transporter Mla subunit MlaD